MRRRKYRIAALMAIYDKEGQEQIELELSEKLGISVQMFRLYANTSEGSSRNNLSIAKLHIIAKYFKVSIIDVMNIAQVPA